MTLPSGCRSCRCTLGIADFTLAELRPCDRVSIPKLLGRYLRADDPTNSESSSTTAGNNNNRITTTFTIAAAAAICQKMANLLSTAWHHLIAAINSLRTIFSRRSRARMSADQEQHQALRDDCELINLDEFMSDDLDRCRAYAGSVGIPLA
jgi:hypothetical protein